MNKLLILLAFAVQLAGQGPPITINQTNVQGGTIDNCLYITTSHKVGSKVCGSSGGGGTVTQIDTTSPIGGGPITTTGTLTCTTCTTNGSALTSNLPVIGAGSNAVAVGTRSGNTTAYVTTTGTQTSGRCVVIDANGNHVADTAGCGGTPACTATLAAGTNQIAAVLAANAYICLTGDQVQNTSTLTVSQADVTIDCLGWQIQQATASVHLFTVTGARFSLVHCKLDGNSANTHSAFTINADYPLVDHVYLTNWGTGATWGQITGGNGAVLNDITVSGGSEDGLLISDSSADVHGWSLTNSHLSVSGTKNAVRIINAGANNNYDGHISNLSLTSGGSCIDLHWVGSNIPRSHTYTNINCELSADGTLALISIFGCQYCAFSNFTATDNNHGLSNAPAFAMHDMAYSSFVGGAAKMINVGTQCFLALDTAHTEFGNIDCGGGGGNLNNAASRGMFEIGVSAPGTNLDGNTVHDVHVVTPTGATNAAFRFAIGVNASDTMNDLSFHGNSAVGGTSATAVILSTASSAVFDSPFLESNTFDTFGTGISIGSGITDAQVGFNKMRSVTTRVSDSGTRSRIHTHAVSGTCTLGTSCSLTFSNGDVFTSSTSYQCTASDATSAAAVKVDQTSGTAVAFTGTGSDVVRYVCIGY